MRENYFLAGFAAGVIATGIVHNFDVAWYVAFAIAAIFYVCGIFIARKVMR